MKYKLVLYFLPVCIFLSGTVILANISIWLFLGVFLLVWGNGALMRTSNSIKQIEEEAMIEFIMNMKTEELEAHITKLRN